MTSRRLPDRKLGSVEVVEPRDVVVVGGSAGSMEPLQRLAAAVPGGLPGSVAVTIHIGEQARSRLPQILERLGALPAAHARTGEPLQPGRIYVAPPGCHLLMPAGVVELSNGPRMNRNGTVKWATELADAVRTQIHTTPETGASQ